MDHQDTPAAALPDEPSAAPTASTIPPTPEPAAPAPADQADAQPAPRTFTDWRQALDAADPEELLRHPRIAGRLGDLAEKRARALRDQIRKEVALEQEAARLRQLRDTDPQAFARADRERELRQQEASQQAQHSRSLLEDLHARLSQQVSQLFPAQVVDQLAGRTYDGSYAEGLAAYVRDLSQAAARHQESGLVQAELEKRLPALRKQVLAEINGGAGPSITGGGQAVPGGPVTQDEWSRHRQDRAWRKANRDRISQGVSSGLIRHD